MQEPDDLLLQAKINCQLGMGLVHGTFFAMGIAAVVINDELLPRILGALGAVFFGFCLRCSYFKLRVLSQQQKEE
jgi:hypothetical protein